MRLSLQLIGSFDITGKHALERTDIGIQLPMVVVPIAANAVST
jgi:hypothetical protein